MQGSLFDLDGPRPTEPGPVHRTPPRVPATDPKLSEREVERLTPKALAVLAALRAGPKSNLELTEVGGLRFGARIADLRALGYDIRIVENNRGNGRVIYELKGEPC